MGVKIREKPKGSGVWWVFIPQGGRRKSKRIGSKKAAQEVLRKLEPIVAGGKFRISQGDPFKQYADHWLNDYIGRLRRASTHERYKGILKKYVYPAMGEKALDTITKGDIRDLLLDLHKRGLSKSTLNLVRDAINGPMSYAVDEELITVNPVSGVIKRLNLDRKKGLEVHPLTGEEVELFLNESDGVGVVLYPFFLCAFRTGMRLGELLALEWGDIDFNSRFIEVKRSYKRGRISPTKTGKSRRVDMSDQLTEALKMLYKVRKREALREGIGVPIETVFHRNGKPMEQNFIRRQFKRVLRKAGLRDIRFHDIRHTYASLLLSYGESPVYVKEQMGHHSINVTVDLYGHWIPSGNRKAVNRLDSATKRNGPKQGAYRVQQTPRKGAKQGN